LAGGGLKMGQVIGQSNRDAGEPNSNPVHIRNLVATVLHTLFDVGQLRLVPGMPREIAQTMTGWEPIGGLLEAGQYFSMRISWPLMNRPANDVRKPPVQGFPGRVSHYCCGKTAKRTAPEKVHVGRQDQLPG